MTVDREVAARRSGRALGPFDRFDATMTIVAAVGAGVLIWLGLGLTFFWDEWDWIETRSLANVSLWFVPHNEHWSTLPAIAYRVLVESVGLGSYVPFHALLIAIHVCVALAVYVLVRRTTGPWAALVAGSVILFFGSGFENLFWAFQIGFVGTTALCLGALLVLDAPPTPRRVAALLALLLAGLATSGLGLPMAVVVGVEVLLTPAWRRHAWILAVSAAVFAVWFVLVGRRGVGAEGNPWTVAAVLNVPGTILEGISASAGGVTGLGPLLGIIPGLAVFIVAARRAVARRLSVRAAACLMGIVALYALVGLARVAQPGGAGDAPRLTYFSGPLLLVAGAALIGRPAWPSAEGFGRPVAVAAIVAILAVTSAWNLLLLATGRQLFVQRADITRALMTVELSPAYRGMFDRAHDLAIMPSADSLERIVARYGSPLRDALANVPPVSPKALAKAEAYILHGGPIPVP